MKSSSHQPKVVIFLYNRLFDPLIQSNFWLYIQDYLKETNSPMDFHLITYEDACFPLTAEQQALVNRWEKQGLKWKRLQWNAGTGIKAKLRDLTQGFWAMASLRSQGYKHVVSLASVAGSWVCLYAIMLRFKFFLYQFEPHSEYARDNGMWSVHGWQFKISRYLEYKAARSAQVIASGTRFMQERLSHQWKVKGAFFKIATVAHAEKFTFAQAYRNEIRAQLNLSETTPILFYPGKFGGLYYREETAWMYRWLQEEIPNMHFLIVTPHDDEEVHGYFAQAGVHQSAYTIAHCGYEDIHKYYCAADLGVIAVPPGPSKHFISNIKVGEYLCTGLPYLITQGVSEDYLYARAKDVGVVVDDFNEKSIKGAVSEIKNYFSEDKSTLRARCRAFGLEYRGFEKLNPIFKQAVNTLVNS